MSLIALLVILLFLAGIYWFVNYKIPNVNSVLKWIINAVIIITAVILALVAFGIWDEIRGIQVPKI